MKLTGFMLLDTLMRVLLVGALFCGVDFVCNWFVSTQFEGYTAPPVAKVLGFSLILLGLWDK